MLRLARARGAGDEHDAVGPRDRRFEARERGRLEAELGQIEHQPGLVEQPQHDLLAPDRRQARDAEVEIALLARPAGRGSGSARPGQAPLGDVELRQDLDARGDALPHAQRQAAEVREQAVHAEAHRQLRLVGLDVDVGGPAAAGLDQHAVDEAHRGAVRADTVLFAAELFDSECHDWLLSCRAFARTVSGPSRCEGEERSARDPGLCAAESSPDRCPVWVRVNAG